MCRDPPRAQRRKIILVPTLALLAGLALRYTAPSLCLIYITLLGAFSLGGPLLFVYMQRFKR